MIVHGRRLSPCTNCTKLEISCRRDVRESALAFCSSLLCSAKRSRLVSSAQLLPLSCDMKQILENLLRLQNLELGTERAKADGQGVEELRKTLPTQVLLHYDRLRTRGKKGIAAVRGGVCAQCHMQVAVGVLALVRRQDNLYRCQNCGCYLLLVEDAPLPAAVLGIPPRQTKPARRGRPPKVPTHVA